MDRATFLRRAAGLVTVVALGGLRIPATETAPDAVPAHWTEPLTVARWEPVGPDGYLTWAWWQWTPDGGWAKIPIEPGRVVGAL